MAGTSTGPGSGPAGTAIGVPADALLKGAVHHVLTEDCLEVADERHHVLHLDGEPLVDR